MFLLNPAPGDRILLCTDGLSNQLSDEEIGSFLQNAEDPQAACHAMVATVLSRGAPDNVTVAVLCFD